MSITSEAGGPEDAGGSAHSLGRPQEELPVLLSLESTCAINRRPGGGVTAIG